MTQRKTVGELTGHSSDPRSVVPSKKLVSDDLIGVEIELEWLHGLPMKGVRPSSYNKYWSIVKDGSLRGEGSAEFILSQPLAGRDLVRSLINFEKTVSDNDWEPDFSDRTSVHIHVDVRDMTKDEVRNFIILYTIFERVLFKYAGPDRNDNIFCPGFEYSQAIIENLHAQFNYPDGLYNMGLDSFEKYTSCNLKSILVHGSLEFRQHAGEFKASRLLKWINILLSMRKYATGMRFIPENIPMEISMLGTKKFTGRVFGKYLKDLEYPELDADVLEGIRLAQDIIHYEKIEDRSMITGEVKDSLFEKYMKKLGKDNPKEKAVDVDLGANMEWVELVLGHNNGEIV